jgi:hypothetical protein
VKKESETAGRQSMSPDPRSALTMKQADVMSNLASGDGIMTAATRSRVHPERVRRWLATTRFQRALAREREAPSRPSEVLRRFADVLETKGGAE